MAFRINHIHVKALDPLAAANWFVEAFRFTILDDFVRPVGDRFIRCATEDGGINVNFTGERTNEKLPPGLTGVHLGLEHFGLDTADIDADIARLKTLGAELEEGPMDGRNGQRIAFMGTPFGVRIELIQSG